VTAGLVIFVGLVGGPIVWMRLHALRLPANSAVAWLPRDLFLVVASGPLPGRSASASP
jgi:hypothetical protein